MRAAWIVATLALGASAGCRWVLGIDNLEPAGGDGGGGGEGGATDGSSGTGDGGATTCVVLHPNGQPPFQNQSVPTNCTEGWMCLLDNDGDTTTLHAAQVAGARDDGFQIEDPTPVPATMIVEVQVVVVARTVTAAPTFNRIRPQLLWWATQDIYDGFSTDTTTQYAPATHSWKVNPRTNQPWQWAELPDYLIGALTYCGTGDTYITEMYANVCYQ